MAEFRRIGLPALFAFKPGGVPLRVADVDPTLARWIKDIGQLPFPTAPLGLNVGQVDFDRTATHTHVDRSGRAQPIDLPSACDMVFDRSVPVIETGSAIRFDQASDTAKGVADGMELDEYIHQYLAVDMVSWVHGDPAPLIERPLVTSLPLRVLNAVKNEAARTNPHVREVFQISHSFANLPMNLSLGAFPPRDVATARLLQFAPLCAPLDMQAALDVKNTSRGKNSIWRGGMDGLEELATALSAIQHNEIYQFDITDGRLPIASHGFVELAKAFRVLMTKDGSTVGQMIDRNHAQRPPQVSVFVNAAQDVEFTIRQRSWTQEQYLENPSRFPSDRSSDDSGEAPHGDPFAGLPDIPSDPGFPSTDPVRPDPPPTPSADGAGDGGSDADRGGAREPDDDPGRRDRRPDTGERGRW